MIIQAVFQGFCKTLRVVDIAEKQTIWIISMPVAHILLINYSVVPVFASFLILIKKGFHDCTGEVVCISFGFFYNLFWIKCYHHFVDEVYKMHWKYEKYSKQWYDIIEWEDVFKCKNRSSLRDAFCPKSKETKSETAEVAKEIKIISNMSSYLKDAMSGKFKKPDP